MSHFCLVLLNEGYVRFIKFWFIQNYFRYLLFNMYRYGVMEDFATWSTKWTATKRELVFRLVCFFWAQRMQNWKHHRSSSIQRTLVFTFLSTLTSIKWPESKTNQSLEKLLSYSALPTPENYENILLLLWDLVTNI